MTNPTHRWAEELKDSVEVLKTVRDEVKVQVHLGSMEAKARFTALETRLENEQLAVRNSLKEMIAGFREVKEQLKRP
jgi:hypothetical protein